MSATALPADSGLIFHWEPAHRSKWVIAGFLVISFFLHAFCFYLFQIIYEPAVALLPPPARVNIIAAKTEEDLTLLRWIEAEDPALASSTQRSPDAKAIEFPTLEHMPSYRSGQPVLKELPPAVPDPHLPSSQPPGPVPIARTRNAPETVAVQTRISFSSEVTSLGRLEKPEGKWSAATPETPRTAEFRVAITGRGLLRYCFLQTSSGDAALDEQARRNLERCRFTGRPGENSAPGNDLVWALATVEWGNDVALPTASMPETKAP